MIENNNAIHPHECPCFAWNPIIVGALIIVGLSFLLNLFYVAIGLTVFKTTIEGEELLFGGLLAIALGIIASMFTGGWITGYLSSRHCNKRHLGALYGFLAWCLALIIAVFLAEHVQQYILLYKNSLSASTSAIISSTVNIHPPIMPMHAHTIIVSTYILFSLFFISAFACSLGGHCGMRYLDRYECK